jgi:hypothetical protein
MFPKGMDFGVNMHNRGFSSFKMTPHYQNKMTVEDEQALV